MKDDENNSDEIIGFRATQTLIYVKTRDDEWLSKHQIPDTQFIYFVYLSFKKMSILTTCCFNFECCHVLRFTGYIKTKNEEP